MRLKALILVAALAASAHADPAPPSPTPADGERDPDRVLTAKVIGGFGIAAVVTGVGMGLVASREYHDAIDQHCGGGTVCDPSGYATTHHAIVLGNVGTGFGVVGVGLLGAAAFTYFTAPRIHATVAPVVSEHGGGLAFAGRF
jgi:hypothetical protein